MSETTVKKPLPTPTSESLPYWEGCRNNQLLIQCCPDCGKFRFYPRAFCPECHSEKSEWVPVSGRGTVFAFTIGHRAPSAAFAPDAPYTVAIIELDEGVRMMSNLVGCPPESVTIGLPVQVFFEVASPEISLPKFRPIANPSESMGDKK